MELLLIPKTKDMMNQFDSVDGYIVGVKGLSTSYNVVLDVEQIKKIDSNKKVFLAINKIIFNDDLVYLEQVLREIEKSNVTGLLFYDLSVLSLVKRLNLNIDLVWNQTHMVTNYNTCNYYKKMGVVGAYLANEISLEEMLEIRDKTELKLFANVIFKPIMSHSRRNLLTNYFHSINKNKEKDIYTITEKNDSVNYLVKEDDTGTTFVYGNIVNGIEPLFSMKQADFSYCVIDTTYLNADEIGNAVSLIDDILDEKIELKEAIAKSKDYFGNDTGFFYKKTIYKVK